MLDAVHFFTSGTVSSISKHISRLFHCWHVYL